MLQVTPRKDIHIYSWMMALGLTPTEAVIYAFIYEYGNEVDSEVTQEYIALQINMTKSGVAYILNKLESARVIEKHIIKKCKGHRYFTYSVTLKEEQVGSNNG